jgi:hypothetical protein
MAEKAITFEKLEKICADEAKKVWAEICSLGGFGTVSIEHSGGLDISGLPKDVQSKIQNLLVKKEGKN